MSSTKGRGGPGRGQGRRSLDGAPGLRRVNVMLDSVTVDVLRRIGGGELSLGIRRAARLIMQAFNRGGRDPGRTDDTGG